MNTDAAKKQPISRKSMLVNQGWKQTDSSAFTPLARDVGYVDQSGNLYAGGHGLPVPATAITDVASGLDEPKGEFNVDGFDTQYMNPVGNVVSKEKSVMDGSFSLQVPPPLPNTVCFVGGRTTPSNAVTSGRNTPATPAVSTLTNVTQINKHNASYVELMRLQRGLAEGDARFKDISNKTSSFNKALWLHVWPYTKLILVPDFSFKNPDFVGEMFERATVTNNCAIQMCEGCLEYLSVELGLPLLGRDSLSVTNLVTFWQTHGRTVKKTFVNIRNSVVDGMKASFVQDYLLQKTEFVDYVKNMGAECPEFDEAKTEFQNFLIYTQYKWNKGESLTNYRSDFTDEKLGEIAKKAYVYFLECFACKTVRKRVFCEQKKRMKISEILTVSDEAFAYVVVELGFQLWSKAGRKEIVISKESRHRPKFREDHEPIGAKLCSTKSIYDTLTCATYYNRKYEEVENSRILDESVKFEDDYLYKNKSQVKSRKRQRSTFSGRVESGYYIAVQGMKQKRRYV